MLRLGTSHFRSVIAVPGLTSPPITFLSIARNIILLTMIFDGVSAEDAWPIFFHFFLDQHSCNILRPQCQKLIQCSPDMKTWKESKYGTFITFCTDRSLREIRRHWAQYLDLGYSTPAESQALLDEFLVAMKSIREVHARTNITNIRSAGPLVLSSHFTWHQPSRLKRSALPPKTSPITPNRSFPLGVLPSGGVYHRKGKEMW